MSAVVIALDEFRERKRARELCNEYRWHFARTIEAYASDVARQASMSAKLSTKLTVPWKRCDQHAFVYLYGPRCPMCIEDAFMHQM